MSSTKPLSFSKLVTVIEDCGYKIRTVYVEDRKARFIECESPRYRKTFLIYIPSKYTIVGEINFRKFTVVHEKDKLTSRQFDYLVSIRGTITDYGIASLSSRSVCIYKKDEKLSCFEIIRDSPTKQKKKEKDRDNDIVKFLENATKNILSQTRPTRPDLPRPKRSGKTSSPAPSSTPAVAAVTEEVPTPVEEFEIQPDEDYYNSEEETTSLHRELSEEELEQRVADIDKGLIIETEETILLGEAALSGTAKDDSKSRSETVPRVVREIECKDKCKEEKEDIEVVLDTVDEESGEVPSDGTSPENAVIADSDEFATVELEFEGYQPKDLKEDLDSNLLEERIPLSRHNSEEFETRDGKIRNVMIDNSPPEEIETTSIVIGIVYVAVDLRDFLRAIGKDLEEKLIEVYQTIDQNEVEIRERRLTEILTVAKDFIQKAPEKLLAFEEKEQSINDKLFKLNELYDSLEEESEKAKGKETIQSDIRKVKEQIRQTIGNMNMQILRIKDNADELLDDWKFSVDAMTSLL